MEARFRVTTGWLSASVDGHQVVDQRIATDPERFWDHYQSKILTRIYDHVMEITQQKPMPDKQPFYRDLDIEVWMSEPDFRIDLDEEQVSSLESLHEDLYFVTLDFFDALGRKTVKRRLAAPGKILPIIHPARDGQPGRARVLYAGNASAEPKLLLTYKLKGTEEPTKLTLKLEPIDVTEPEIFRAVVGKSGIKKVELTVRAKNDQEAARAVDALDALDRFHQAGLCTSCLSYDHVDGIAVTVLLDNARARRLIRSTGDAVPSRVLHHSGHLKHPLVTWDHVISPDESEEIIEKLSAYPEVNAFRAGHSYRGRDISVLEITAASPGGIVSLAKETTYKPTILITGRQHANEVSSTSHILKLAERLVTVPSYKEILKKVNIILHPVENPDGAQIAYDLQKLTPTHMLHAGRYSAIGMDVASQVGRPDPLLPEARVRGRLWRDWLPDIYLNPHGYPSHEWVQQFAGYVPPRFRSYLSSRGWYTSVRGLRDPRYPHHAEVAAALREAIVRQINNNPEVRALNLRHQARYRRWAFGFQPYVYNQEIYKDTAIYYGDPETGEPGGSRRAGEPTSSGRSIFPINAWPQVTYFRGGTEAPDETAQGEWLNLVSQPGFSYLMACIQYLRNGAYTVERIGEEDRQNHVTLTLFRPRPVLPPGSGAH